VRFAKGFSAEVLGHGHLFRQRSDDAYSIIEFGLPQLIEGESGRVLAVGVVPHAVRSSGERLNPVLDEGANQLETRHLFPRHGSHFPNPLHQGLRDRHFFLGQLMRPRRSGPKNIGGLKFFEPKFLTNSGLILGIKPPCPPARIVLRHSQIEIFDVRVHLAAETAGLTMERAPDDKDSPLERLVGFDPQEAFTQRDKARNV
jgi:hypothetical protein